MSQRAPAGTGSPGRAYVARRLAGEDALLMAHSREDCRELSRLIRDDLIHLGLVDDGPSVQISEGERASAGKRFPHLRRRSFSTDVPDNVPESHTAGRPFPGSLPRHRV